ncbi:MAG: hypothetical protein GVY24_06440 [Planctomycetes bacterium]|nr:hypothetical protein [Planctomycetota bacterium]
MGLTLLPLAATFQDVAIDAWAILITPKPEHGRLNAAMAVRAGERLEALRADARANGGPLPAKLPYDTPLFSVPTGLIRILDRDLDAAGIAKRDERGRTIDVHAMRHSTLDLTMNTYTDPRLLDVAGAMDVLPTLPLDDPPQRDQARATGTDVSALVPTLVPASGNPNAGASTADKTSGDAAAIPFAASAESDAVVNAWLPVTESG